MQKALFFSGVGTVYSAANTRREEIEIYPETLPALRFLVRRGFRLVLVTSEYWEYKSFIAQLKDKSFQVLQYNPGEEPLPDFVSQRGLRLEESYYITDGIFLKWFSAWGCPIILVLSGKGCCTVAAYENKEITGLVDVCKDIYAAAFSIALKDKY